VAWEKGGPFVSNSEEHTLSVSKWVNQAGRFSIVVYTEWTLWIFLEFVGILFLGSCTVIEKEKRGERNQNEKHAKGKQMSPSHMQCSHLQCSGKHGWVWINSFGREQ
jgi:hypothetical protein